MRNLNSILLCLSFCLLAFWAHGQEYGLASYYSDTFQGRKTASGERYNKNELTAAHKTIAFGTVVRVTRLDNKKSVTVRINDRGPYIKGRIVDLSRKAAAQLGIIEDGHAEVKLEEVGKSEPSTEVVVNTEPDNIETGVVTPRPVEADAGPGIVGDIDPRKEVEVTVEVPPSTRVTVETEPARNSAPAPRPQTTPRPAATVASPAVTAPAAKPIPAAAELPRVKGSDFKDFDLYKIELLRPAKSGFGVQVASMSSYENVMKQVAMLQEKWFNNILLSIEKGKDGKPLYKIILGPLPDRDTADAYRKQLKKKKKVDGFVVDLSAGNY